MNAWQGRLQQLAPAPALSRAELPKTVVVVFATPAVAAVAPTAPAAPAPAAAPAAPHPVGADGSLTWSRATADSETLFERRAVDIFQLLPVLEIIKARGQAKELE